MKIIKPNPAKGWKVYQYTLKDGSKVIKTGYDGGMKWHYHQDNEGKWFEYQYTSTPGYRTIIYHDIAEIDNIIFEADVKYIQYYRGRSAGYFRFNDHDGIHSYDVGMSSMNEILKAIASKKIKITEDGFFSGLWTFKKQGSVIYMYLVNEEN